MESLPLRFIVVTRLMPQVLLCQRYETPNQARSTGKVQYVANTTRIQTPTPANDSVALFVYRQIQPHTEMCKIQYVITMDRHLLRLDIGVIPRTTGAYCTAEHVDLTDQVFLKANIIP